MSAIYCLVIYRAKSMLLLCPKAFIKLGHLKQTLKLCLNWVLMKKSNKFENASSNFKFSKVENLDIQILSF